MNQLALDLAEPLVEIVQRAGRHLDALIKVGYLIALCEIQQRLVGALELHTHVGQLVFQELARLAAGLEPPLHAGAHVLFDHGIRHARGEIRVEGLDADVDQIRVAHRLH